MAPEQFRNAKNADIRCDIYSLGATLYQMVTGELPFRSNGPLDAWMKKIHNELLPPRQLVPGLSERVDWAIRRAMSADPDKRPNSCREFIEDLTGHSTRRLPAVDSSTPQQELWYLVYKDETGAPHTVKGTMSAVRRSLKDGLLGDASNVRASRDQGRPVRVVARLSGVSRFGDRGGAIECAAGAVAAPVDCADRRNGADAASAQAGLRSAHHHADRATQTAHRA